MFFSFTYSFAQDTSNTDSVPKKVFDKAVYNQFTKLITGKSLNSVGNYVATDINLPEAKISYLINLGYTSFLQITASGGTSDGFLAFFNNTKFNSNFALDLQYNFFFNPRSKNSITYTHDPVDVYNSNLRQINYDRIRGLSFYEKRYDSVRGNEIINMRNKIQFLNDSVIAPLTDERNNTTYIHKKKIDSLSYIIDTTNVRIDSLNYIINNYPGKEIAQSYFLDKISEKLRSNELVLNVSGCRYGWFSLGYKVNNNDFNYFDPLLGFNSQISKKTFLSHEIRLQYSFYNWALEQNQSYFWCLGSSFKYSDNFSDLDKLEIWNEIHYDTNIIYRKSVDKFYAYTGEYKRDIKTLKLYGDYFHYFFSNNILAIHGNPELSFKDIEKPSWNLSLGLLICLLSSKDNGASVINTVIYYRFFDVFKSTESSSKLYNFNDFGIKFSFPYNFL